MKDPASVGYFQPGILGETLQAVFGFGLSLASLNSEVVPLPQQHSRRLIGAFVPFSALCFLTP